MHSFVFGWLIAAIVGQSPRDVAVSPVELEQIVEVERSKVGMPGVSVAVRRNGAILLNKGFGFANLEQQTPATEKSVYQIASMTKPFTATAIMMLVEDEKLSLDDPIAKHISAVPATWEKVTIRHLLTHTSGIKSYTELPGFSQRIAREETTHERFLKSINSFPLTFDPGGKFSYSNSGYYLLGMVIEKVSGKPYADFLRDRVFKPLGMESSRVNDWSAVIPLRAAGYTKGPVESNVRNASFISMTWPFSAGAVVSTVDDLLKFDLAIEEHRLLKSQNQDQMWLPTTLTDGKKSGYGLGWTIRNLSGRLAVGHNGGIPGFSSDFIRIPKERVSVIVLANLEGNHAGKISTAILQKLLGISASAKSSLVKSNAKEPIASTDEDKETALVRRVIEEVASGKADPKAFSGEARESLFPNRIRQAGESLARLGKLNKIERVERNETAAGIELKYRCEFGDAALTCKCVLDRNGKISGILFLPE